MFAQSGTIIAVDDNDDEQLLLRHAARQAGIAAEDLVLVNGGQEAIDYLCGLAGRPGAPPILPRLMLLDLAMPCFNGFEVLDWVRRQPIFQRMPVVVLTNSAVEQDQARARKLGAAEFVAKPRSFHDFVRLLAELRERYFPREAVKGGETLGG